MGLQEAIIFGTIALVCAAVALILLRRHACISAIFGTLAIAEITTSLYNWRFALIDSGKNTQWLGFDLYPPVAIICAAIIAAGLVCIISAVRRCSNQSTATPRTNKTQ